MLSAFLIRCRCLTLGRYYKPNTQEMRWRSLLLSRGAAGSCLVAALVLVLLGSRSSRGAPNPQESLGVGGGREGGRMTCVRAPVTRFPVSGRAHDLANGLRVNGCFLL